MLKKSYLFLSFLVLVSVVFFTDELLKDKIDNLTKNKYLTESNVLKNSVKEIIKNNLNATLNISLTLSQNSDIIDFLEKKSSKIDLSELVTKYDKNTNLKNIWLHIVDKDGFSKYRSWTNKRDDNILDARKDISLLIQKPKINSVISVGLFDMTLKSTVPIYNSNSKFIGFIETIAKVSSIVENLNNQNLKLIILADKKYKSQIKKPFTNEFIWDFYVANKNVQSNLKELITKDIYTFVNLKDFIIKDEYLITTYKQPNINGEDMGYFIIFKELKDIDLNDIENFKQFIRIIFLLITVIIVSIIIIFIFYNRVKYTKTLENEVEKRSLEIKNLQKKYEQIFNKSKALKFVVDPKTKKFLEVNKSAINYYGYSYDEFLALESSDIVIIEKEKHEEIYNDILNKRNYIFQVKHKLKSGQVRDMEVYASPIEIDEKTYIYSIVRDITEELKEQKRVEEKEKIFHQQAKMASMGEMLENIAHQWRQPLSTITTAASGSKLKKELNQLDDDFFYSSIDLILESSNYLSNTIEDFRDFFKHSKIKEDFNICEVIENAIKLSNLEYININVELICDDISYYGYKNELLQALINILNNSRDCLIEKTLKYIQIKVYKNENSLKIEIFDNGGGVDENLLYKILDPYFTTKHQAQGTGIGLYMTNQIITIHFNGEISLQNINFSYQNKDCFGLKTIISLPLNS